jgi:23S rRNA pseudouridine1911/1915/1917 synthase
MEETPLPEDNDFIFIVSDADADLRLDVFLSRRMRDISRSQLQRLIGTRAIQVNGETAKPSCKTQAGDLILVELPAPRISHIAPERLPLDIVWEDQDLIVLNKPKGMVVHPAPGAESGTLVNALLAHCQDLSGVGGVERPGIVHRLDKDTTGLLVVAKNDVAHNGLQGQIQKRTATRKYRAIVWGRPPFTHAVVDVPIGRHPTDRKRMTVVEPDGRTRGRAAVTELSVLEPLGLFSLLEAVLQTGRTHQIRVHCAFAGYPVVGDPTYGGLRKVSSGMLRGPAQAALNERIAHLRGQALHAFYLAFYHPRTKERLEFEVPPPQEMTDLLEFLRSLRDASSEDEGGARR